MTGGMTGRDWLIEARLAFTINPDEHYYRVPVGKGDKVERLHRRLAWARRAHGFVDYRFSRDYILRKCRNGRVKREWGVIIWYNGRNKEMSK